MGAQQAESSLGLDEHPRLAFSFGPDPAVFKVLFLPDGYDLFEVVDGVLSSLKSRTPVSRGYDNRNTRLANSQPS